MRERGQTLGCTEGEVGGPEDIVSYRIRTKTNRLFEGESHSSFLMLISASASLGTFAEQSRKEAGDREKARECIKDTEVQHECCMRDQRRGII